jgi:hypothetical protein
MIKKYRLLLFFRITTWLYRPVRPNLHCEIDSLFRLFVCLLLCYLSLSFLLTALKPLPGTDDE